MKNTLACPACDEAFQPRVFLEPGNLDLLCHMWTHLPISIGLQRVEDIIRICWCGEDFPHFFRWMDHIWNLDVQAHYLESVLNIGGRP